MTLAGKAAIVTGAGLGLRRGHRPAVRGEGAKVLVADIVGQQAHRVTDAIATPAARRSRASAMSA